MPKDKSIIYLDVIYLCLQLHLKIIDSNHSASNQYNKTIFKSTEKNETISGKKDGKERNYRIKLKIKEPRQKA